MIQRKRDNLDDVIYYENIAQVNDSILNLVSLSDEERHALFIDHVDKLKIAAEEEKEREEAKERSKGLAVVNSGLDSKNPNASSSKGPMPSQASSFYFYNPTTVAYGKNEFVKIWGDRALEDNWRWSSNTKSSISTDITNEVLDSATEEELFDPQFYISKIPSEEKVIDSLAKDRNYAYYQLGLIYKEKFKEYELAKDKFKALLNNNPDEKLVVPSKYNLYKIYTLLGENDEASIAKNEIISNYPDSRYATILNNPEQGAFKDENSPDSVYENVYKQFEDQDYAEVISKSENYINVFEGEPIVAKFELLKATATGRLHGFEEYSNAINFVALNYANTLEGQQAENISSNVLPKLSKKEFVLDSIGTKFKVLYQFENSSTDINSFNDSLAEIVKTIQYYDLITSIDVYNTTTTFVVVHGLKSIEGAKGFAQLLKAEDRYKISRPYIAVSSANYQIIQIHKNLDMYLKDQQ